MRPRMVSGALALVLGILASLPARADDVADFYRGRVVNLIIGYGPGGGYDIYARLLARFIGGHIPGKPTVVAQNMPGAGTMRAANHLFVAAPRDGATIGIFDRNMPLMAFVGGSPGIRFDPREFVWLGSLSSGGEDAFVLWARKSAAGAVAGDLVRPGGPSLRVGVAGPGANDHDVAVVLRDIVRLRLDLVVGYPDSNASGLATEAGEVDGQLIGYAISKSTRPAWLASDSPMRIAVQYGRARRHPELPDAPTAMELAPDADARNLLEVAQTSYVVARSFVAPPGTPAERAAALRQAFADTVVDPEFRAEAARLNLDLSPVSGADTAAAIGAIGKTPGESRDKLRQIMHGAAKP